MERRGDRDGLPAKMCGGNSVQRVEGGRGARPGTRWHVACGYAVAILGSAACASKWPFDRGATAIHLSVALGRRQLGDGCAFVIACLVLSAFATSPRAEACRYEVPDVKLELPCVAQQIGDPKSFDKLVLFDLSLKDFSLFSGLDGTLGRKIDYLDVANIAIHGHDDKDSVDYIRKLARDGKAIITQKSASLYEVEEFLYSYYNIKDKPLEYIMINPPLRPMFVFCDGQDKKSRFARCLINYSDDNLTIHFNLPLGYVDSFPQVVGHIMDLVTSSVRGK